jgi:transcriptional regulator with XRE-family HTH domain
VTIAAGKGLTEVGISQNSFSKVEHGEVEIGAEILLRIAREFAKNELEWLLTG